MALSKAHNWLYFAIGGVWLTLIAFFDDLKRIWSGGKLLDQINFQYLAEGNSLLQHGWNVGYEDPGSPPSFTAPGHALGENGLSIDVGRLYAIDYWVTPQAYLTDRLQFSAQYTHSTMIFTLLEVISADGSQRKNVWIKYYFARRAYAEQTRGTFAQNPEDLPEQTCWVKANLEEGWNKFNLNLTKVVKVVFGKAWRYQALHAIRLRGSLSISPIRFLRGRLA